MHKKEVKAELKISRKRTGLTNNDLAILLDVDPARVSRLERSVLDPKVCEIISLCLIYDRDIARLYPRTTALVRSSLKRRLQKIDASGGEDGNNSNVHGRQPRREQRLKHLHGLYQRLEGQFEPQAHS